MNCRRRSPYFNIFKIFIGGYEILLYMDFEEKGVLLIISVLATSTLCAPDSSFIVKSKPKQMNDSTRTLTKNKS